jgi:hypothetical protein
MGISIGPAHYRRPPCHRPAHYRRTARRVLTALLFFAALSPAFGQTASAGEGVKPPPDPIPLPDVYCFSGSPLLLQVNVPDPERVLDSISIETAMSSFAYSVSGVDGRDAFQFYINPFLYPGHYQMDITLHTRSGNKSQSRLDVGFVDFVWGRDNLSFGNNTEYVSVIGPFGKVLEEWIKARFGDVDEADTVLLVNYMYGLFNQNTGYCYAFAGTEVRYWRWPDLLPTYYKTTHDLRGDVERYQREMNFLQFDIIFDHFLAGPGSSQIQRAMNSEQMEAQAALIESRIASGEPVAVGFAGPDLHHSMLVFGIVRNHTTRTVDLLVANNWKNDEKLNIHSRDAEIIRLFLDPDHNGPVAQWRYEKGLRKFKIDRLFMLDVRRDPYVHDRALLDGLVAGLREQLTGEGRAVIVVEDSKGARIVNGGKSTGWIQNRITGELDDVWYEKVGESYRFTCPAGAVIELEIADAGSARVLSAVPGSEPGAIVPYIQEPVPGGDGKTVIRRMVLPGLPAGTAPAEDTNSMDITG